MPRVRSKKATSAAVTVNGTDSIQFLGINRSARQTELSFFENISLDGSDGDPPTQEAAAALKKTLASGAPTVTGIHRHQVTTRFLSLPSRDPRELKGMVSLEATGVVPYAEDEITVDSLTVEQTPGGYSRVLVVIAHNDVVREHLDALEKTGIHPAHITLSSLGLYSLAKHFGLGDDEPFAMVNATSSDLDLLILHRKEILLTRGATFHGRPGTDDLLNEAVHEIGESLTSFRRDREKGRPVRHVALSGSLPGLESIAERLETELQLDVRLLDPFENIVIPDAFAEELSNPQLRIASAAAVGLALAASELDGVRVNLLPREFLQKAVRRARRDLYVRRGLFAATAILALMGAFQRRLGNLQEYNDYLDGQIRAIEPAARSTETRRGKVEAVKSQLERVGTALEVIEEIHRHAPRTGLVLTEINFIRDGNVTIRGQARDELQALNYVENLRTSSTLVQDRIVEGREYVKRPGRGRDPRDYWEFTIVLAPRVEA